MSDMMFVIKYGDRYCHFRSHGEARLTDSPFTATLYTSKKRAQKRLDDAYGGFYVREGGNPKFRHKRNFKIYEVIVKLLEESETNG